MGKFDGLLLVSDFDDTLYDSHHRVPERNLKALDYFRRQGGRFTVATSPPTSIWSRSTSPWCCPTAPPCTTFTRAGC